MLQWFNLWKHVCDAVIGALEPLRWVVNNIYHMRIETHIIYFDVFLFSFQMQVFYIAINLNEARQCSLFISLSYCLSSFVSFEKGLWVLKYILLNIYSINSNKLFCCAIYWQWNAIHGELSVLLGNCIIDIVYFWNINKRPMIASIGTEYTLNFILENAKKRIKQEHI